MTRICPKTMFLLTMVFLFSAWACGSGEGPTSTSPLQQSTSISNNGSFSTVDQSLYEVANEEGSEDDACARSPGFYCQNQNGKNPNMSAEQFQWFATQAASLLATVEELSKPEKIADSVCDPSDQLFRHLSTLALNLSSMRINATDPHGNPNYATVGDAFAYGVAVADGSIEVTREQRKEAKRLIEQITARNQCAEDEYEDPGEDPGEGPSEGNNAGPNEGNYEGPNEGNNAGPNEDPGKDPPNVPACEAEDPAHPGKILICHKGKNTLSIAPDAWPAHWEHEDTCGACDGN